jgi:hypothetical protein
MAGPAWDDDDFSARAAENLTKLTAAIPADSSESSTLPTADLARYWHRAMTLGTNVPDEAYRGGFRGDPHPALADYEVAVGGLEVTRACHVTEEIDHLVSELQSRVIALDELDAQSSPEILDPQFVEAVLETAAWLHCEWVRIHPFANGNGRTARMWVIWVCGRYGLPRLLTLRPRPDLGYNATARSGVLGKHEFFFQYLLVQYNKSTF